jgi:hypothetical protein
MNQKKTQIPLELVVEVVENRGKPGCNSSSTSRLCTCPVDPTKH